jgi:small subunit ribosomal protein S17
MARKRRVGVAVADARHKTVSVRVERTVQHPLYKKVMRRRKRYLVHDEGNDCKIGDSVLIEECRPLSKHKTWRVIEVLDRREVAEIQPQEIAAPSLETEAAEGEASA